MKEVRGRVTGTAELRTELNDARQQVSSHHQGAVIRILHSVIISLVLLLVAFSASAQETTGRVTVHVYPRDAELLVDGEALPTRAADVPLELPVGSRKLEARMPGYAGVWRTVEIKPGNDNEVITLRLSPGSGELIVTPHNPQAVVEIDGKQLGRGARNVALSPGLHEVRIYTSDTDVQSIDVVIRGGGSHRVNQSSEGLLATDAPALDDESSSGRWTPPEFDKQGIYFMGYFSGLFAVGDATGHERDDGAQGGIGGSLRVGYRFVDWAGVELNSHFSCINVTGALADDADVSYRFYSVRLSPALRVFVPADATARCVATIGGGFVWDILSWEPNLASTVYSDTSGANGFAQVDLGIEFEFMNLLTDLVMQTAIKTTSGLEANGDSPFGGDPILVMGPALSIGYGVW